MPCAGAPPSPDLVGWGGGMGVRGYLQADVFCCLCHLWAMASVLVNLLCPPTLGNGLIAISN